MPWPVRAVLGLNRRLEPEEGWASVLGLAIALLALAWAVAEAEWTSDGPRGYAVVLLAALLGLLCAKRLGDNRLRAGWVAGVVGGGAGLVTAVIMAAQAVPPAVVLLDSARTTLGRFLAGPEAQPQGLTAGVWVQEHLSRWLEAIQASGAVAAAGQAAPGDQLVTTLILVLMWIAAFWAGWTAFRSQRGLAALVPVGVLIAANNFFALKGAVALMFYLGGLLLLVVALREYGLRREWNEQGIDYSDELRQDLFLYGLGMAIVIVALPMLIPNLSVRSLQRAFWDVVKGPVSIAESKVETVFPGLDRRPGDPVEMLAAGTGALPRVHLLTGGPTLRERVVMFVRVRDSAGEHDPAAETNYRWRMLTYSDYNGRGWENPGGGQTERHNAGEAWYSRASPYRRSVQQAVEFVGRPPGWVAAVGEPVAVDQPYRVHLRSPGDATGLETEAEDYVVISHAPAVAEEQLAASTASLPDAMDLFLALPPSVPDRVLKLAEEIAPSGTPYDKAVAIETYLRQFPYTLEVPAPPFGVDVADHFLFVRQEGYCDYFATAMVVLARAAGLPARLAVGYASGAYDPGRQRFAVTEADAHSWPEVYFPEYGWIPFEPTPSQPLFAREPLAPAEEIEAEQELAALRQRAYLKTALSFVLPLAGLLVLLFGAHRLRREWRLRRSAGNPWQLAYLRLGEWGRTMGPPPARWLTPREYTGQWRAWLADNHGSASLGDDLARLSSTLEQREFAPPGMRPPDAGASRFWRRINSGLWRLRIRRALRRGNAPTSRL